MVTIENSQNLLERIKLSRYVRLGTLLLLASGITLGFDVNLPAQAQDTPDFGIPGLKNGEASPLQEDFIKYYSQTLAAIAAKGELSIYTPVAPQIDYTFTETGAEDITAFGSVPFDTFVNSLPDEPLETMSYSKTPDIKLNAGDGTLTWHNLIASLEQAWLDNGSVPCLAPTFSDALPGSTEGTIDFAEENDLYKGEGSVTSRHNGFDLDPVAGGVDQVVAPFPMVIRAVGRGESPKKGGGPNSVFGFYPFKIGKIGNNDAYLWMASYHNKEAYFAPGQIVPAGAEYAAVGDLGLATGPHVHQILAIGTLDSIPLLPDPVIYWDHSRSLFFSFKPWHEAAADNQDNTPTTLSVTGHTAESDKLDVYLASLDAFNKKKTEGTWSWLESDKAEEIFKLGGIDIDNDVFAKQFMNEFIGESGIVDARVLTEAIATYHLFFPAGRDERNTTTNRKLYEAETAIITILSGTQEPDTQPLKDFWANELADNMFTKLANDETVHPWLQGIPVTEGIDMFFQNEAVLESSPDVIKQLDTYHDWIIIADNYVRTNQKDPLDRSEKSKLFEQGMVLAMSVANNDQGEVSGYYHDLFTNLAGGSFGYNLNEAYQLFAPDEYYLNDSGEDAINFRHNFVNFLNEVAANKIQNAETYELIKQFINPRSDLTDEQVSRIKSIFAVWRVTNFRSFDPELSSSLYGIDYNKFYVGNTLLLNRSEMQSFAVFANSDAAPEAIHNLPENIISYMDSYIHDNIPNDQRYDRELISQKFEEALVIYANIFPGWQSDNWQRGEQFQFFDDGLNVNTGRAKAVFAKQLEFMGHMVGEDSPVNFQLNWMAFMNDVHSGANLEFNTILSSVQLDRNQLWDDLFNYTDPHQIYPEKFTGARNASEQAFVIWASANYRELYDQSSQQIPKLGLDLKELFYTGSPLLLNKPDNMSFAAYANSELAPAAISNLSADYKNKISVFINNWFGAQKNPDLKYDLALWNELFQKSVVLLDTISTSNADGFQELGFYANFILGVNNPDLEQTSAAFMEFGQLIQPQQSWFEFGVEWKGFVTKVMTGSDEALKADLRIIYDPFTSLADWDRLRSAYADYSAAETNFWNHPDQIPYTGVSYDLFYNNDPLLKGMHPDENLFAYVKRLGTAAPQELKQLVNGNDSSRLLFISNAMPQFISNADRYNKDARDAAFGKSAIVLFEVFENGPVENTNAGNPLAFFEGNWQSNVPAAFEKVYPWYVFNKDLKWFDFAYFMDKYVNERLDSSDERYTRIRAELTAFHKGDSSHQQEIQADFDSWVKDQTPPDDPLANPDNLNINDEKFYNGQPWLQNWDYKHTSFNKFSASDKAPAEIKQLSPQQRYVIRIYLSKVIINGTSEEVGRAFDEAYVMARRIFQTGWRDDPQNRTSDQQAMINLVDTGDADAMHQYYSDNFIANNYPYMFMDVTQDPLEFTAEWDDFEAFAEDGDAADSEIAKLLLKAEHGEKLTTQQQGSVMFSFNYYRFGNTTGVSASYPEKLTN